MDPFKQDPALLFAFRQGDQTALADVYKAFVKPLRNFVLRGFAFKSGSRDLYFRGIWTDHDLDDIVQETFRRAFGHKARQSFDGIRPYKNYLFTIARNAVINDLTARNRQIPVGEALTRDAPSDELSALESWVVSQRTALGHDIAPTCEEQLENLEVYGLVEAFLETLEIRDQRFFRLRFLAQLSQEKTANRMGWNRARVRKLEGKLRRGFLTHVQGTGYLDGRAEARVRRAMNVNADQAAFGRARQIWREGRAELANEIFCEAA